MKERERERERKKENKLKRERERWNEVEEKVIFPESFQDPQPRQMN